MSLFDVIKYPISDPPTLEEFEALPEDLLINWMTLVGFTGNSDNPQRRAFNFYSDIDDHLPILAALKKEELSRLKEIIRDLP